jgi:hypothetical protein
MSGGLLKMEWTALDRLIIELEKILAAGAPQGWREFWDKAREIQEGFNARVRYPTKEDWQAAWERFNALRNRASEHRRQQKPSSEAKKLDSLVDELEILLRTGTCILGPLSFRSLEYPASLNILTPLVYDWRPVWDKTKEIQALFNAGVRYPTKELRDQAWVRFNNLRNEASKRANEDRETIFNVSRAWRDSLWAQINAERYSTLTDAIFFFDPTTIEEMKRSGQRLRDLGRRLSEVKEFMLKEHKDECFQLIQEVRATHDNFWGRCKQERERRQQAFREKVDAALERLEGNINKNEERKANSEEALARCEANIEKLLDMRDNARGEEFRVQVDHWLEKAYAKRDSIRESIGRAEEWITQDVERRNDIYRKRR